MDIQLDHSVLLGKHSRREFRQRMASGELQACIIPVAATEQHLEHLAMEHDWRSVMHVAVEVAKRLQPRVIVAPAMNIGISEHHMSHAGTISALPGSWLAMLADTILSMRKAGFNHILVLNGHGGNIAACQSAWPQLLQRLEGNLQFRSYWDLLPSEQAEPHLKTKRYPGHAQEFETAFALAAFPENVRHDAMDNQADKEPLAATAEAGAALIDMIVANVADFVTAMTDGKQVAEVPPFFP